METFDMKEKKLTRSCKFLLAKQNQGRQNTRRQKNRLLFQRQPKTPIDKRFQNSTTALIDKLEIGSILLALYSKPENQRQYFKLFEVKLRRYVENYFCK